MQVAIQRANVNDHTRSCPHKQCPHAISGCAFTGTPSLVAQHEAAECEWRAVACPESGCGARVSARELARHICRQCTHREAGCRFEGGSPTLVARHEAAECEWRSLACPEPGCGARVAARDLEAHRARHALQQGAEQLARRPDRQPRRGQAAAIASAADRPPGAADEEEKAWAAPAVESVEAEAALERMLALQQEGAVVVVDVGGRRFSTAVSTVKKFPGSLLARVSQPRKRPAINQSIDHLMLILAQVLESPQAAVLPRDVRRRPMVFVDGDSASFRLVLQWMRWQVQCSAVLCLALP